jgi:hypothetical protein
VSLERGRLVKLIDSRKDLAKNRMGFGRFESISEGIGPVGLESRRRTRAAWPI